MVIYSIIFNWKGFNLKVSHVEGNKIEQTVRKKIKNGTTSQPTQIKSTFVWGLIYNRKGHKEVLQLLSIFYTMFLVYECFIRSVSELYK